MPIRKMSIVGAALVAVFSLTACGSDETPKKDDSATTTKESPSTDTSEETPATSEGTLPSWAEPFESRGDKVGSVKLGDVTVDVYQIATLKASRDSLAADSETRKPLINKGDDLVYVQYVVTNNGKPIDLSNLLVDVNVRYDDWKYLGGMPGISDSDQYEELKLNDSPTKVGVDTDVYTLGQGESYGYAENFLYQKGKGFTVKASYTPVDDAGERQSDESVEAEGTGAIK